jgi:hypothetical protein
MPTVAHGRLDAWTPAALLVAGSVIFLGAGRLHPRITAALGPLSSEEFFRAFATEILQVHHWERMHTLILLGPVLWALAAVGATRLLPPRVSPLGDVATGAMLLAAAFWAVGFVLDGFVTPVHARTVAAAGVGADATALAAFRVTQLTMARLGMFSVVLVGVAVFAFSAALLYGARALSWRTAVGVSGLFVGAWPALAALQGEFSPGPFTSPYWTATALVLGLWFLAFGVTLPTLGRVIGDDEALRGEHGESLTPARLVGSDLAVMPPNQRGQASQ